MIRISNPEQFNSQVVAWIAAVRSATKRVVFRMAYDAQQFAMSKSPIYSGDFGSNWNVSAGRPDTTFVEGPSTRSARAMVGLPIPSSSLWGRGSFNLTGFQLGMTVFITNAARHRDPETYGTDYYAWKIEDGKIQFRDENINAGRTDKVAGKTLQHLARNYRTVTRGHMV